MLDPSSGLFNPPQGQAFGETESMAKTPQPPRKRKVEGFYRSVIARNIRELMARKFSDTRDKERAMAKGAGVSLSTVQRILKEEVGATIDTIEALAEVFDVSVYQLMLPALDPDNPQVIREASAEEKRLYRAWHRDRLALPEPEPAKEAPRAVAKKHRRSTV